MSHSAADLDPLTELILNWLDADLDERQAKERKEKIGTVLREKMLATVSSGGEVRMPSGQGIRLMPPVKRFDPILALIHVPKDQLAKIIKTDVDRTLAKEQLAPEVYALCQKTVGEPFLKRI